MKKLVLLVAAIATSFAAMAQVTINNPVDEYGRYIVLWDCDADDFAASNAFEPGENATIAFDVTGTVWEEALKAPEKGGTRALCANLWTNFGRKSDDTNRLVHLRDNIYGATMNFATCVSSYFQNPQLFTNMTATDSIVYVEGQLFMFEYDGEGGTLEWYINALGIVTLGGDNVIFATAPSTGRQDADIYNDDFAFPYAMKGVLGYAAPCVDLPSATENVEAVKTTEKVMVNGQLVLIHNGVQYTVLGAQK